PSRPRSSATIGAGRPHHPLCTVSPALSRRASEKALAGVMRSFLAVIDRAGGVDVRSSPRNRGPSLLDSRFRGNERILAQLVAKIEKRGTVKMEILSGRL